MENKLQSKLSKGAAAAKVIALKLAPELEVKDFPFPMDALPQKYREIIQHYSEFKSFPLDFFASSVLTACGSAFGASNVLRTPDGYINRANLYMMQVAQPGINKSGPLDAAYEPILSRQSVMYKAWRRQQADMKRQIGEMKIKAKEDAAEIKRASKYKENTDKIQDKDIINSPDNEGFKIQNTDNTDNTEIIEEIAVKFAKHLMMDCTAEALLDQLDYNPRGTTILYDELVGFVNNLNKYRTGNDVQLFLSLFQGSHISRDTLTHGTVEISNPFVSIIGTIQPEELENAFAGKIDNGFFDRFLIVYLTNVKKPYPKFDGVNPVIKGLYNTLIYNHIDLYEDDTRELTYTKEGYDIIYSWTTKSIDKENHQNTSNTERAIRAKMLIYVHRFALILQMMQYSITKSYLDKDKVNETACIGATKLADYFLFMAEKTRIRSFGEVVTGQVKQLYDAILNEAPFTTKEFHALATHQVIPISTANEILKRNIGKLWVKAKHGVYQKII